MDFLNRAFQAILDARQAAATGLVDLVTDPVDVAKRAGEKLLSNHAEFQGQMGQAFPDPKNPLQLGNREALAKVADAMLTGPLGMAPAGTLRIGGRPDLIATHSTDSLDDLIKNTNREHRGVAELYAPSFAIQKNGVSGNFGSTFLVPKVGSFDPRTHTSTVFNRDAFTPRFEAQQGGSVGADFAEPAARLYDRFTNSGHGQKFGEEGLDDFGDTIVASHRAAIQASPAFNSFKSYEKSPYGAGTLIDLAEPGNHWKTVEAHSKGLHDWYSSTDLAQRMAYTKNPFAVGKEGLNGLTRQDLEHLKQYREAAKGLPSEYGELKVQGPVPITREHFAGVIGYPGMVSDTTKAYLSRHGIPLHTVDPVDPKGFNVLANDQIQAAQRKKIFDIATAIQEYAGPARRQPIFP